MARETDRDVDEPSSPTCYLAETDPAYSGLVSPSPKAKDGEGPPVSPKSAQITAPPEDGKSSSDPEHRGDGPDASGDA